MGYLSLSGRMDQDKPPSVIWSYVGERSIPSKPYTEWSTNQR